MGYSNKAKKETNRCYTNSKKLRFGNLCGYICGCCYEKTLTLVCIHGIDLLQSPL